MLIRMYEQYKHILVDTVFTYNHILENFSLKIMLRDELKS